MITLTIILATFIIRKMSRAKLSMARVELYSRIIPTRNARDIYTV